MQASLNRVNNATDDLQTIIGDVAEILLGKPNVALSKPSELRFGSHGSLAVNLDKGTWYSHEEGVGGGTLDLIAKEAGLISRADQLAWLKQQGLKEKTPVSRPENFKPPKPKITATYSYEDENGKLLLEVVRFEPKDFRQRQPNVTGGWNWSVKSVRQTPFRLPQLLAADPAAPVFIVEGEKDVLRLESLGLVATCNSGGAGKWPDTLNEHFNGRHVVILADNDAPGRKHADNVSRALDITAADTRVLCLPNLPAKGDVSNWLDAGGTADQLLKMAKEPSNHPPEDNEALQSESDETEKNGDDDKKMSQSSLLVKFVEQRFELFHDSNKDVYARDRTSSEVRSLTSRQFRDSLQAGFYTETGKAPRDQSIREALGTLAGLGRFQGECLDVHLRTAGSAGEYFLDLAVPGSSRAVRLCPGAWEIVDTPAAMFVRPESMQPLPDPIPGSSIEPLWRVANIPYGSHLLALTWMIECLRPDTPYPVAELLGEQGSGKSGTQTAMRRLIDPNACDLRGAPKSVEDVFVSAGACCIVSYENISHLAAPMQDALCTIATGGGHAKRKLYSDCEESIISVKRPIILNGISACVTAQDLVDRTITIETPVITERLEVTELWRDFDKERPKLLGALLDIAVKALELLPTMHIPAKDRPRLVEFARLGMAVAAATGRSPSEFMIQFNASRQESLARTIDASPVATAVVDMAEDRPEGITAPVKEILLCLERYRPSGCDSWPKSAKGLGDALRRAAPALRQIGIECKCLGKVGGTVKWEIKRKKPTQCPASPEVLQSDQKAISQQDIRTSRTSSQEVSFDESDFEAF